MAQEYQYFYEDEVYRFNKKGNLELGMVLENAEFVSSDEEFDVNDEEEDKVTKGSIRVAWYPKGEEQVLQERKVGLADRSLMPGDVVRRLIRGKDTQRGYCRQVHVTSSVQVVGTKHVILNVDSNQLTPLEEFTTDIAVALDSWVGMVHMVKCRLVMVCSDGSRCVMSDSEALELDDMRDSRDRDSEFRRYDFYPGQQLVGCSRAFEEVEWIHKTREMETTLSKPHKPIKVTVEQVQVIQLGVRWQCRAFSNDPNVDKEQPKYLVQGEDLKRVKMLNVFEPCTLQLGDRNYYVLREGDTIMTRDQWRKLMAGQLTADHTNPCPLRPRPAKNKSKRKTRSVLVGAVNTDEAAVQTEANKVEVPDNSTSNGVQGAVGGIVTSDTRGESTPDSDGFIDLDTDDCSDTASISSGASTGSIGKRSKKGPALMTKMMKKRKLKRAKRKTPSDGTTIKTGDQLVVETLMTTSKADVVWQDGSLEKSILSTVLYPIHHLDDQEFFPGDFVVEQRENSTIDPHEYGVVQKVDHAGRTSIVKWFRTYTAGSEPHHACVFRPQLLCEQEVSVYDLRDHPDFRYRPGSVVIRVANFEENQTCSTGQVLDNYPSGEVSVWWVDGKTSVCYPQDLYKVGEYDSDDGELWDDTASDESWETESEHSVIAEESESESEGALKTRLVANIEKARIAMSRLEEIFTQNPALQTTAVMKQLLDCYKECRYMDKLMGTSFFHESNFQGLIEKVRERGRASATQRMTEQINRLFSTAESEAGPFSPVANSGEENQQPCVTKNDNGKAEVTKPNKTTNSSSNKDIKNAKDGGPCNVESDILSSKEAILSSTATLSENLANLSLSQGKASRSDKAPDGSRNRGGELRHKRMSETDMTLHDKTSIDSRMKDSKSCSDLKVPLESQSGVTEEIRTSHMCAQLCSLMKAQLLKTYEEVVFRFGGHFDMSLMQACQDTEGAQGENKENVQNNIVFISSDITINSSDLTKETPIPVELEKSPIVETAVEPHAPPPPKEEEPEKLGNCSVDLASPVTTIANGSSLALTNGNNMDATNRNIISDEAAKEALIDSIIANAVAAINGEAMVDPTTTSSLDAVLSPTEGNGPPIENCVPSSEPDGFQVLEAAPDSHKFKLTMFQPTDPTHFYRTVRKEMKLLKTSLPSGIWVRGYEDRMDLYSVMIRGPERTPYEDGLFFFDFQLSADYPRAPPLCHYVTYCSDKLNPNLYEDGKVCVSLLGTWSGKGTEVWTSQSNLLQVIISIQGLILVSEPYFNEAGYERQKGTQQGRENSRMYNEMVVLKLIQAMAKVIQAPPDIFRNEIIHHFQRKAYKLVQRLECWLEISENHNKSHPLSPTTPTTFREIHRSGDVDLPEFPLIPASKGFCITLRKTLKHFKTILESVGVSMDGSTVVSESCKKVDGKSPKTPVNTPSSETKAAKSPYVEMDGENVIGSNS